LLRDVQDPHTRRYEITGFFISGTISYANLVHLVTTWPDRLR